MPNLLHSKALFDLIALFLIGVWLAALCYYNRKPQDITIGYTAIEYISQIIHIIVTSLAFAAFIYAIYTVGKHT
jgi:hypothetical protein